MIAAIRSEWIKLSTITVTWILAIVAVAFPFVVTVLTAAFADEPSGETLAGVVTGTTVVSGMLLGVIASIGITNEFSHNTIRPTFAAMPDRWRPLLAKPTVHVALTLLLTAVVVALSWAVGRVIAGDSASTDTEGTAAALIGVVLLAVGLTLLGYGLGLLLRNTAATVCLLLLWPLIAEGLIAGLFTAVGAEDATKWLPYSAGINMAVVDSSGEETLGRVPGGLYFFAWVVAITAFGLWSAHRRERLTTFHRMRITLPSGTAASLSIPDDVSMGLVIAPDIFGVRPLFDDMVERLAADWQMAVCAVEPFPGRDLPLDPEPRMAVLGELSDDDHLRDLIEGAAATGQERVGLIGFCMGGMYTLKASRSDRFARLVAFYGMIRVPADWRGSGHREPLDHIVGGHPDRVLAIVGERDPYTPLDDIAALEATGVTVVRYPDAEHGFAHDANRPAHRADDAADAFARAREWLTS